MKIYTSLSNRHIKSSAAGVLWRNLLEHDDMRQQVPLPDGVHIPGCFGRALVVRHTGGEPGSVLRGRTSRRMASRSWRNAQMSGRREGQVAERGPSRFAGHDNTPSASGVASGCSVPPGRRIADDKAWFLSCESPGEERDAGKETTQTEDLGLSVTWMELRNGR